MAHDQRDNEPGEAAALAPGSGPLPPIPDGGLVQAMPDWLREAPAAAVATGQAAPVSTTPRHDLDPAAFLTEDDLPDWLRQLSATPRPVPAGTPGTGPLSPQPPGHLVPGSRSTGPAPAPAARAPGSNSAAQPHHPAASAEHRPGTTASAPPGAATPRPPQPPGPTPAPPGLAHPPPAPVADATQPGANRGVIITGIVLVVITALIVVYLLASGTL